MIIILHWIPAFAGMTSRSMSFPILSSRRRPALSAIQVFSESAE